MRNPFTSAFACALLFALRATALPTQHQKLPVCIVGAGPAGLTAANRLENKGYETVIIDDQPEVGGKCQAYYDENGIFNPLGAAFFSNGSYPETLQVINVSGVLSEPFALSPGTREQFRFNWTTGQTDLIAPVTLQFAQAVASELPRYIALWQRVFAPYSVPSFKNGVPQELTVPGDQWFAKNNFTALPIVIVNPLALYGYGDIRQVPILYILQYMTPDILTAFVGQHSAYLIDFHKVWVQWTQKSIKGMVETNAEVTCIDRSKSHPIVRYRKNDVCDNTIYEVHCSSVVLAFPPTLPNLRRAGLDLHLDEEKVFYPIGTHNYFSQAVKIALPFGVSYIGSSSSAGLPPPAAGEPVAALRLQSSSDLVTAWSWGPYRELLPEHDARETALQTWSRINKDPRNATATSQPVTETDLKAFRKWDYFPHYDSEQLANGYYAKLNRLQGARKTYYASGLNGMETVEWAIRAGKDVVDSYF